MYFCNDVESTKKPLCRSRYIITYKTCNTKYVKCNNNIVFEQARTIGGRRGASAGPTLLCPQTKI